MEASTAREKPLYATFSPLENLMGISMAKSSIRSTLQLLHTHLRRWRQSTAAVGGSMSWDKEIHAMDMDWPIIHGGFSLCISWIYAVDRALLLPTQK